MKKIFILLVSSLLILTSCIENAKAEILVETEDEEIVLPVAGGDSAQKGFVISDMFTKADNKTFLESLIDANLLLEMTAEEQKNSILRLKETTELYIRKNSLDNEENLVINKAELGPTKKTLELLIEGLEKESSIMPEDLKASVLNSGFGYYKDKFQYIYYKILFHINGFDRYSYQYIISVNNENFHIVINTKEGLEIQDVIYEIN